MRLQQFSGKDSAKTLVTFSIAETALFWTKNKHWPGACSNVLREITSKYPKSKRLQFIE